MTTHLTRKVLTVFLASPGDVVAERKIAREVVDEINDSYSRALGWHTELLGWEDTLPGVGRPQERINVEVDTCDLFVGIVWKRWGSPTGEFDSGFHEEFERARMRFEQTGKPERWLFFKQVEPDQLREPESQLKRVQAFRDEQISLREALFKEFTNQKEWRNLFRLYLSRYLVELASAQFRDSPSIKTPVETRNKSVEPSSSRASLSSARPTKEAKIGSKSETLVKCHSGHVVVLRSRTLKSQTSLRPLLVLTPACDDQSDDRMVCMITARPSGRFITIADSDFIEGSLSRSPAYVRPDRLFPVDASQIVRVVGRLNPSKMDEILNEITRSFSVLENVGPVIK